MTEEKDLTIYCLTLASIKKVPAGNWIVILSEIPKDPAAVFMDKNKIPLRQYWTERKIFKRRINAEKYFAKMKSKYWSEFLQVNNLINPN